MCIEKRKASPKADCPAERGEIAWTPQTSGVRTECPAAGDPLHKYVGTSASYSLLLDIVGVFFACCIALASRQTFTYNFLNIS